MKTDKSRSWTRVSVSISYDDNHCTTVASKNKCIYETLIVTDTEIWE